MVTVVDVTHLLFTTNASRIRAIRYAQRHAWPNEQWKLPWIEGNNCVKLYVHARPVIAIVCWDRPLSRLRPINHFCIDVRFAHADRAWRGVIISRLAGRPFFAASSTCVFFLYHHRAIFRFRSVQRSNREFPCNFIPP